MLVEFCQKVQVLALFFLSRVCEMLMQEGSRLSAVDGLDVD
jgi:hypothetical protein